MTDDAVVGVTARVETLRSGRYLRQLCRHLARKLDVELGVDVGRVRYGAARCELRAGPTALHVAVSGPATADADRDRLVHIVEAHLHQFARTETLAISWRG